MSSLSSARLPLRPDSTAPWDLLLLPCPAHRTTSGAPHSSCYAAARTTRVLAQRHCFARDVEEGLARSMPACGLQHTDCSTWPPATLIWYFDSATRSSIGSCCISSSHRGPQFGKIHLHGTSIWPCRTSIRQTLCPIGAALAGAGSSEPLAVVVPVTQQQLVSDGLGGEGVAARRR